MVRNGLDGGEAHAVAQADLGDGAAFHLHQQGGEGVPQPGGPLAPDGEPVAGGHPADGGGVPQFCKQRGTVFRLPGGEVHPVDGGHQSDGIAHGRGVHIVLDKFRGNHQRPGGQIGEASGHTGVENQIHAEVQAENLGGHGGVDLAHAAGAGQNARRGLKERNAGHGFHDRQIPGAGQGVELGGHGELQCDIHTVFQLLADCM